MMIRRPDDPNVGKRLIWEGVEVEGSPYKGEKAVFVSETPNTKTIAKAVAEAVKRKANLYICPPATWDLTVDRRLEVTVESAKAAGLYVTVALTPELMPYVSAVVGSKAHLMIDVILEGNGQMSKHSVKLVYKDFETATVYDGELTLTRPEDYAGDIPIK